MEWVKEKSSSSSREIARIGGFVLTVQRTLNSDTWEYHIGHGESFISANWRTNNDTIDEAKYSCLVEVSNRFLELRQQVISEAIRISNEESSS